jgi:hypothetical protein
LIILAVQEDRDGGRTKARPTLSVGAFRIERLYPPDLVLKTTLTKREVQKTRDAISAAKRAPARSH